MGFDGILTSVFKALEMSPDTKLMKKEKQPEQWRLDARVAEGEDGGRMGGEEENHLLRFGTLLEGRISTADCCSLWVLHLLLASPPEP